jgi:glycosyltransferase involved in cell wall biosynthesis
VVPRLVGLLRGADVVQTWMYHPDLLGGVAARLAGVRAIAWGIRHSELHPEQSPRLSHVTKRVCAVLAHVVPTRVLANSTVGRDAHVRLGYPPAKMQVIPNGFDLSRFAPDAAARSSVRRELGLDEGVRVIGHVGRWDPMKDHRNLLEAAARLGAGRDAHLLLCGDEITPDNRELAGWIAALGLGGRVHLLGRRDDVPRIMAALDLLTLCSSFGEGFPNVVGEAMACAIPCVVTDVGDAGRIVGDTGRVVPLGDPTALARGFDELLALPAAERARLGAAARRRIEENYAIDVVASAYASVYRELARR